MKGLYLYHNGPRGAVLLCRAAFRELARTLPLDLVLGACRDDAPLLHDLQGPRCRILASDFRNTLRGAVLDLGCLRPEGYEALEVAFGSAGEPPSYQWPDLVESLEHDLRQRGIAWTCARAADDVPMLDFTGPAEVPELRRPSIWLDNARTASDLCHFVLDLERLLAALPGFDLLCTAAVATKHERLVELGSLSPPQLQRLSERCAVRVGLTMDPFYLTLTEANRYRPKALCGYDARVCTPAWDYPGNPLELLGTMDELVDFLLANTAPGAPAEVGQP